MSNWIKRAYNWTSEVGGGRLDILRAALQSFNRARAPEAAAGMAFYGIFSLFPLLLTLVAAGSFFLETERASQQVVAFTTQAIPISQTLIERNITRILEQRGTIGAVGLVGLLWSATGLFTILTRNISRAWPGIEPRGFLKQRLIALGMVGTLAVLLALWLLSSTALSLLPRLEVPMWAGESVYKTLLWTPLSTLISWLSIFLLFLGLYRWAPKREVNWSAAFWGALAAAVAWEIAKRTLTWYVSSGAIRYDLVYGSLSAVVALMLWMYISSWIALFGAHLTAAIAQRA